MPKIRTVKTAHTRHSEILEKNSRKEPVSGDKSSSFLCPIRKEHNMKKFLFPENGNQYKANLHCHSTCSDGHFTPEELKKRYVEKGYSIIAFTDHEVFYNHNDLTDDKFLALNASEISVEAPMDENGFYKVTHLGVIAKDKENQKATCFHPGYLWYFSDDIVDKFVSKKLYFGSGEYNRVYSVDGINDMIKTAKNDGFLVIYNHIGWSRESVATVSQLENLDGFEIYNHTSYLEGKDNYDIPIYDDLLWLGRRYFPVAGDDNHNRPDYPDDSFGGMTYIIAPELKYESVISALENGNCYSSLGPQIKNLWYEDGKYHIETSPAREIFLKAGNRRGERVAAENKNGITEAVFDAAENDIFVRFTVVDFDGKCADTRAYEVKDIM